LAPETLKSIRSALAAFFTRFDRLALVVSLAAVVVTYALAVDIFDAMPHLEDEIAYVWQAEALAQGHLTVPSPPHGKHFLIPFVVDHEGQRFGKYPIGWPLVLAVGVLFGLRTLVNPMLAGIGVWLTYRLGKHVFGEVVGLLAAGLTLASPFFLLNSGSLLSHPLGLVLSAGFALAWLRSFGIQDHRPRLVWTLLAAFLLGYLVLTRPFTALGVALPFALHGAYLFLWGKGSSENRRVRRVHLSVFVVLILAAASLLFIWQYAVTGDPFLNPYTLWWPYDKIGFGPGVGPSEQGHNLRQAIVNTRHSLSLGVHDLFGWGYFFLVFIPFGLWAARRNAQALLLGSVFPVLIVVYLVYWVGSSLFGPRYYYEGLYSLTLFTAAGIAFLAGWRIEQASGHTAGIEKQFGNEELTRKPNWWSKILGRIPRLPQKVKNGFGDLHRARPGLVYLALAGLMFYNLVFYAPDRLAEMHGLYGISAENLKPFLTEQAQTMTPALIITHPGRWMPYGALLDLQDPFLTSPFIFVFSRGPNLDAQLIEDFPDRNIFHYYPADEPHKFYATPRD
jgi:hypothetical protein